MALKLTFRKIYLYLFAIVGLVIVIIGGISFIDLGLKKFIFTKADYPCYYSTPEARGIDKVVVEQQKQCEEQRVSDKQRQASVALAQLIVGLPLYLYHWRLIRNEGQI